MLNFGNIAGAILRRWKPLAERPVRKLLTGGALVCLLSSCMSDTFTVDMGDHRLNGDHELPFEPGEKLTYKMVWNMIPVGYFTVEVMSSDNVAKKRAPWHFRMRVKTNDFADTFYKVRNSVDAVAEIDLSSSVTYDFIQRQGDTDDTTKLTYAADGKRVHVVNQGEDKGWLDLPHPCVDPLTMFYAVRMQTIERAGQVMTVWVSDGTNTIRCPTLVVAKEILTVNDKPVNCWLLEPDLKELHGVFKKSKGAKLRVWVSADKHKIPLRIASRVIVGSFQGRLVEYRPGGAATLGNASATPAKTLKIVISDAPKEDESKEK